MLATISCLLYRVVQWTRKLGHKKTGRETTEAKQDPWLNLNVRGSFFLFRSVPFQCVRWFRFGFSHKPKTRRLDGRPLFFFSRPRPHVSRLRRPGSVRAQPSVTRACAAATSIKLSRRNGPRRHWIDINWVPVDLSICLHLSEWYICIFCPTEIVVSTLRVSTTKNGEIWIWTDCVVRLNIPRA